MNNLILTILAGLFLAFSVQSIAQKSEKAASYTVVLKSEVQWDYLNPARGDLAPMAGTLWGNRKSKGATGFLLKPSDGFQSPPHTHNVSYRAVVINGLIHNDDPDAANMWLPSGSFWTQPKGEVHVTAAKGSNSMAYVEIEEGPYLVLPVEDHFDSGERPVNLDESNMVWLDVADITWIKQTKFPEKKKGPELAFLWGKPEQGQLNGSLVRLPKGFKGSIETKGGDFNAVLVQGELKHQIPGNEKAKTLDSGSFFSSKGKALHIITGSARTASVFYVRSKGKFEIIPRKK